MKDLDEIKRLMLNEAKTQLKEEWPTARVYIEESLIELAGTLEIIKNLEKEKKITPQEAKIHLEIWEKSCNSSLEAGKIVGKVGATKIVNGMVKVGKGIINRYVGFPLL